MWDDDEGYDTSDPKHSAWHGTMSGLWDDRDKFAPRPIVDRDPGDETEEPDVA